MKKIANSTNIHQKQGLEQSKRLYRITTEQAKRLDDARGCARNILDLFNPHLQIQRSKFCEYCERLIFSDPTLYGKKGEELLWRKAFYDPVLSAKKLKKQEYSQEEVYSIQTHIYSGIGFYHHLISKIQSEYSLDLKNVVDFVCVMDNNKGDEWAKNAIHQSLIYLGDLNRYKLEIYPKWEPTLAFRYYLQAISFKPECGMPHNQMGTLAMTQNNYLDAVYHYIRCLACQISFDGTINNLQTLFEKNSKYIEQLPQIDENVHIKPSQNEHVKRFIARFLLLIDIWYFNKKVTKVYNLCHQTYKDLEDCLTYLKNNRNCVTPIGELEQNIENDLYLSSDMLFKMTVICLLTISKLQNSHSQQVSTVIAFTLAIYSQLIQHVTNHIYDSVSKYPLPELELKTEQNGIMKSYINKNDKKNKKKCLKLRRRKALKIDSDSEEDEIVNDVEISSEDEDDLFDAEILANSSSEDEEDNKNDHLNKNVKENNVDEINKTDDIDVLRKVQRMDGNIMLEIIEEQTILQSIKILNDWLMYNLEIIKSCGTNTRSLLRQIVNLFNLININIHNYKLNDLNIDIENVLTNENKIPLSEDVVLKGVELLKKAHNNINWYYKCGISPREEAVVRVIKFMSFGKFLTTVEQTGISFDKKNNIFICKYEKKCENEEVTTNINETVKEIEENGENGVVINKFDDNNKDSESNGQLMKMKHMGQLWLASEVRALENRVRGKTSLSPYLVLDTDALIKYTFMVKHLVNSRKFIVLIPSAVVSALDDLKREQSEARDAIRWLESQFHRGNRFFRAQRPQERAPIPYIKYPKKKDKEMCLYIQIIECCHYLAEQQMGATNLVTLLIGNHNVLSNGENKEFSYVGLAESVGIAIESITQFYGKWKKSYKGKR